MQVDPRLVEQFQHWLNQDAWQVDVHWSVLTTTGDFPTRPWRWTFVAHSPAGVLQKQESEVATDRGAEAWSSVWEGRPDQLSDSDREGALQVLQQLAQTEDRVGLNAAILAARLQRSPSPESLARLQAIGMGSSQTSESESWPLAMRCAATEAWCFGLSQQTGDPESLLSPAGRHLMTVGLPVETQGTLWRGLSTRIPPDRIPGLSASLGTRGESRPADGNRRAALDACLIFAARQRSEAPDRVFHEEDWPPGLLMFRLDEDPVIRRYIGLWVSWSRHPDAPTLLAAQLRDIDPQVRETAIQGLGLLDAPEARKALHSLAANPREPLRAMAVAALSRHGLADLRPFLQSESTEIRVEVARGLEDNTAPEALEFLRRLLVDPQPEVQLAALESARRRPSPEAIPLLLLAVEQGVFSVRKSAQRLLADHLDQPPVLPVEADASTRRDAVRNWAAQHGYALLALDGAENRPAADEQPPARREFQQLLATYLSSPGESITDRQLFDQLIQRAQLEDLPVIEMQLSSQPSAITRQLEQELLPRIAPIYVALLDLQSPNLQRRRDAARRLQIQSQTRPLSPYFVGRMAEILVSEQDFLVWQGCLAAIQEDGHADASRLALLAVHHSWPDLRRLGVEHFERHPRPEMVPALLPLLNDAQPQVRLTAIRTLGASGNPLAINGLPATDGNSGTPGLRSLMVHPDEEIRWAALTALAHLRDEMAAMELQRLLLADEAPTRTRAAFAMGDSGYSRFVEPLIRASWTESHEGTKRTILTSLESLVAPTDRPDYSAGLVGQTGIDDKLRSWVTWWESQRTRILDTGTAQNGAGELP